MEKEEEMDWLDDLAPQVLLEIPSLVLQVLLVLLENVELMGFLVSQDPKVLLVSQLKILLESLVSPVLPVFLD